MSPPLGNVGFLRPKKTAEVPRAGHRWGRGLQIVNIFQKVPQGSSKGIKHLADASMLEDIPRPPQALGSPRGTGPGGPLPASLGQRPGLPLPPGLHVHDTTHQVSCQRCSRGLFSYSPPRPSRSPQLCGGQGVHPPEPRIFCGMNSGAASSAVMTAVSGPPAPGTRRVHGSLNLCRGRPLLPPWWSGPHLSTGRGRWS